MRVRGRGLLAELHRQWHQHVDVQEQLPGGKRLRLLRGLRRRPYLSLHLPQHLRWQQRRCGPRVLRGLSVGRHVGVDLPQHLRDCHRLRRGRVLRRVRRRRDLRVDLSQHLRRRYVVRRARLLCCLPGRRDERFDVPQHLRSLHPLRHGGVLRRLHRRRNLRIDLSQHLRHLVRDLRVRRRGEPRRRLLPGVRCRRVLAVHVQLDLPLTTRRADLRSWLPPPRSDSPPRDNSVTPRQAVYCRRSAPRAGSRTPPHPARRPPLDQLELLFSNRRAHPVPSQALSARVVLCRCTSTPRFRLDSTGARRPVGSRAAAVHQSSSAFPSVARLRGSRAVPLQPSRETLLDAVFELAKGARSGAAPPPRGGPCAR